MLQIFRGKKPLDYGQQVSTQAATTSALNAIYDVGELMHEANERLSRRRPAITFEDVEELLVKILGAAQRASNSIPDVSTEEEYERLAWLLAPFNRIVASPDAIGALTTKAVEDGARSSRALYRAILSEIDKALDLVKVRVWASAEAEPAKPSWRDYIGVSRYLGRA